MSADEINKKIKVRVNFLTWPAGGDSTGWMCYVNMTTLLTWFMTSVNCFLTSSWTHLIQRPQRQTWGLYTSPIQQSQSYHSRGFVLSVAVVENSNKRPTNDYFYYRFIWLLPWLLDLTLFVYKMSEDISNLWALQSLYISNSCLTKHPGGCSSLSLETKKSNGYLNKSNRNRKWTEIKFWLWYLSVRLLLLLLLGSH